MPKIEEVKELFAKHKDLFKGYKISYEIIIKNVVRCRILKSRCISMSIDFCDLNSNIHVRVNKYSESGGYYNIGLKRYENLKQLGESLKTYVVHGKRKVKKEDVTWFDFKDSYHSRQNRYSAVGQVMCAHNQIKEIEIITPVALDGRKITEEVEDPGAKIYFKIACSNSANATFDILYDDENEKFIGARHEKITSALPQASVKLEKFTKNDLDFIKYSIKHLKWS